MDRSTFTTAVVTHLRTLALSTAKRCYLALRCEPGRGVHFSRAIKSAVHHRLGNYLLFTLDKHRQLSIL
jgi:hypothetical protein